MQYIYVILSATPTMMGKIIRTFTRSSFNHSSISLTEDWNEMYSFARYRASNPLVGGFVKEFPRRLSLGKDESVYIKVYKIPVTDEQFTRIKRFIYKIRDDNEQNIYNTIAPLGILTGHCFNKYKAYTCSDFVAHSLVMGGVILEQYLSKNIVPDEMQKFLDKYTVFSGCLNNYSPVKGISFENNDFFAKTGFVTEVTRTCNHFYSLIKRNKVKYYKTVNKNTRNFL